MPAQTSTKKRLNRKYLISFLLAFVVGFSLGTVVLKGGSVIPILQLAERDLSNFWQKITEPKIDYTFKNASGKTGFALLNENKVVGFKALVGRTDNPKTPQARFEVKDAWIDFSLTQKSPDSSFKKETSGNRDFVVWKGVLPDADFTYQVDPFGLKEQIILNKPTLAQKAVDGHELLTLPFYLTTYNVVPRYNLAGKLVPIFLDSKTGDYRFHIENPYLVDARGERYDSLEYELKPLDTALSEPQPQKAGPFKTFKAGDATKKSAFADLVHPTSLLKDWPVNLAPTLAQGTKIVKPQFSKGVDSPGVEPGRFGLTDQSSKPAEPTQNSSYQEKGDFVNGLVKPAYAAEPQPRKGSPYEAMDGSKQGSRYLLVLKLPREWLADPSRAYPVILDPTITHNTQTAFATGTLNRVKDEGVSDASPLLTSSYHELAADQNTVGLWHMNEALGNVADASGNGNTGTPTGTTVVAGKFGNARSFNGTSDIIVFGSLGSSPASETTELWIYPTNKGTILAECDNSSCSSYVYTKLGINADGTLLAHLWNLSGTLSFGKINYNQWYHVALTYDGNTLSGYLNGVLMASKTGARTPPSTHYLVLGKGNGQCGGGFDSCASYYSGYIDEFKYTKKVLSPEEIKQDAQRFPYSVYTSPVVDLTQATGWTNLTWLAKGVRTGDGEVPVSTSSLVAQWNFNDASGTSAPAAAGTCGASCNGTLTGFANTTGQDVVAGSGWTANNRRWGAGALMFDGSDDWVSIPNSAALNPSSITVEGWVKLLSGFGGNPRWIGKSNAHGGSGYMAGYWSGAYHFVVANGTTNTDISTSAVGIDEFHHVVGTFDSSTGQVKLFIDGIERASGTLSGTIGSNTTNVYISGYNGTAADLWRGTIDSARIYSRALTAAEILANYQAGNIEFQTRTSADNSTWEAWKPVTGETQLLPMDADVQPDAISGLRVWLKADAITGVTNGAQFGTWSDSSGLANNFTQATGTKQPTYVTNTINGKPVVRFTAASSQTMTNATNFPAPVSVIYVVRQTGGANQRMLSGLANNWLLGYWSGGKRQAYFEGWVSASGSPATDTSWHIYSAVQTGSNSSVWEDGVQFVTSSTAGITGPNGFSLSGHQAISEFSNGDIAEVLVYNTALNDTDRRRIENYLANKYALGLTSPIRHSTDSTTKFEGTGAEKLILGAPQPDASTVGLWHLEETSGTGAYIRDSVPSVSKNNILAYWKMDESSAVTAADATGLGNTATDKNSPTVVWGKIGNARSLNGSNAYLEITSTSALKYTGGNLSLSAWIYANSTETSGGHIISKPWNGAGQYNYRLIYTASNTIQFCLYGSTQEYCTSTTQTVPTGSWHQVAATVDSSKNMTIYIDGVVRKTDTHNITGWSPSNGDGNTPLAIGTLYPYGQGWAGNTGFSFDGYIDEVGIWASILSQQDINDIYSSGNGLSYGNGGNHGTPTGTTVADGFYGKARSFNGTSDYISIAHSSTLKPASQITIEAWVRPNTGSLNALKEIYRKEDETDRHLLSFQSAGYCNGGGGTGGCISFGISTGGTYTELDVNIASADWEGSWHHVVATYDGSNKKIYKDGALIGTETRTGAIGTAGTASAIIGSASGTGEFFNGLIDEVRISNVARSAEEIAEAYRAGRDHRLSRQLTTTDLSTKTKLPFYVAADRPGTYLEATVGESAYANYEADTNTVGLWHLEEQTGSGAYIKDSSGSNNHGTPTGTTFVQGKIGKGRKFAANSDVVTVSSSTSLNSPNTNNAITIDSWIYPTGNAIGNNEIVQKTACYGMKMYLSGSSNKFRGYYWGSAQVDSNVTLALNTWYHVAFTFDGTTIKQYVNGIFDSSVTSAGTIPTCTQSVTIGGDGSTIYFPGIVDETRISNSVRSADDIRQAYEVGRRTHPVTIDFTDSLVATDLITGSTDTAFNIKNQNSNIKNIYVGDKIIVKENVGGTEYIAQGTVATVNTSTGAVTVASWDAGSTFPTGGFTANATVFKWQREYFDLTGSLTTHRDAITRITLRDTDGSQGANVWLDDIRSNTSYISDNSPDSYDTATGIGTYTNTSIPSTLNRYFQYRALLSSWDTPVSPQLTSVALNYSSNSAPGAPTISAPLNAATQVSLTPAISFAATDADLDYLRYKIQLATDAAFSVGLQTFDQTLSQTGWSGQNAQTSTAYTSGSTATYTVQTPLTGATTYYIRAYATDPGGTNTWGNASSTISFTTNTAPNAPTISSPTNAATGVSLTPTIQLAATDAYGDYIRYKIQLATDNGFTLNLQTFDQTSSQTGWSGQDTQTSTAYLSGSTASYTISSNLSQNTVYYIRAYAKDPGGANLWSSASSTFSFTTVGIPAAPTPISPANNTYRALDEYTNTSKINTKSNVFFTPEDKAILQPQY